MLLCTTLRHYFWSIWDRSGAQVGVGMLRGGVGPLLEFSRISMIYQDSTIVKFRLFWKAL